MRQVAARLSEDNITTVIFGVLEAVKVVSTVRGTAMVLTSPALLMALMEDRVLVLRRETKNAVVEADNEKNMAKKMAEEKSVVQWVLTRVE